MTTTTQQLEADGWVESLRLDEHDPNSRCCARVSACAIEGVLDVLPNTSRVLIEA